MSLSKIQIAIISILWLVIDMLTKYIIEGKVYILNKSLNLITINQPPAFTWVTQMTQYSMQIAIGSSVLILVLMACLYRKYYHRVILFSIGMIMAGVSSNLIDILYFGYKRVFIDFHHPKLLMFFERSQIPFFNLADILIALGILFFIFNKKW